MTFKGYSFRLCAKEHFIQRTERREAYRTWVRFAHPSFLKKVYALIMFRPCEIIWFEQECYYESMISTARRCDAGNLRELVAEMWLHDADDIDATMGYADVKQLGLLDRRW